jgi:hypothetical protein
VVGAGASSFAHTGANDAAPNENNVKCIASLRHGVGASSLYIPGNEPDQNDVVPVIPVLIKTMMCF